MDDREENERSSKRENIELPLLSEVYDQWQRAGDITRGEMAKLGATTVYIDPFYTSDSSLSSRTYSRVTVCLPLPLSAATASCVYIYIYIFPSEVLAAPSRLPWDFLMTLEHDPTYTIKHV